jgi:cytochrome c1
MSAHRSAAAAFLLVVVGACSHGMDEREAMAFTHGGRASVGRQWLEVYGCGGCHQVPGIPGARGQIGPPLGDAGARLFVAGVAKNDEATLVSWIYDPQRMDSATAMPKTGVTQQQARDIAAYLYTLPR